MSTTKQPPMSAMNRQAMFHTTRWSVVLAAQAKSAADAQQSLDALCRQYWPPLYAYVRGRGHAEHDAQDLTQAFFARLLEKDWLASAKRERGRFRTFLLMAFKRFLANEWHRTQAQKRSGSASVVSLDAAEQNSLPDPKAMSAESMFERRWALTLLESVMLRLLPNLPIGEWEFQVWHPRSGYISNWPKGRFRQRITHGDNHIRATMLQPERFVAGVIDDAAPLIGE